MRRTIFALTGTLALLALAAPAAATEPEYGVTTTTITEECGTATITWTNSTPWEFTGDYKLLGEGGGTPDEMTGQTIAEGPLAGKPFGKLYDPQLIPAGDNATKTLTFAEDSHDGKVKIMAWVKRGPEQMSFSADEARVDTDCEAPVEPSEPPVDPTEPPVEPTEPPTTEPSTDPSTDPSETDAPTTEPTDDEDVDGDKANDDGSAPTPVPQPAHLAVTG